jgi:hypothetical protein
MNVTDRVEALIRTAGRLIALIEREIELLRAMKPGEIGPLQEEKAALALAYQDHLEALSTDRQAMAALAPALREELTALALRLETLVGEDERAVTAAREAHDRLLRAIVEAVQDRNGRNAGYAPPCAGRRPGRPSAVSLSVDRNL